MSKRNRKIEEITDANQKKNTKCRRELKGLAVEKMVLNIKQVVIEKLKRNLHNCHDMKLTNII